MDVNLLLGIVSAATVLAGTTWQIARDLRKDRAEQETAARDEAVRQAVLEERVRQLREEVDRDDA